MEKCCNSWSKGQRGSHIVEEWSRMVNGYDVWGISTNLKPTIYDLVKGGQGMLKRMGKGSPW